MSLLHGTCICNRCGTEYEVTSNTDDSYRNEYHCPNCNTLYDMINNAIWFKEDRTQFDGSIHISDKQISEDDYITILWLYFHSFSAASISLMYQVPESVIRSIILECRDEGMAKYQPIREKLLKNYNVDVTKPPQRPRTN